VHERRVRVNVSRESAGKQRCMPGWVGAFGGQVVGCEQVSGWVVRQVGSK
jgi:hypothetical protein